MSRRHSRIYAGKTLIVPVPLDGAPSKSKRYRGKRQAENGIYIVRSGDSVYDIARAFNVSMSSLKNLNSIGRRGRIYVNQRLRVPGLVNRSGSATLAYQPQSSQAGKLKAGQSSKRESFKRESFKHKVRRGENLTVIARRYSVSVAQLRRWNNLGASAMLHPNQILKIERGLPGKGGGSSYVVRSGDSLWKIARRFGVTVRKLKSWNNLSSRSRLYPGQSLSLRPSGGKSNTSPEPGSLWHTVRRGENLSLIAKLYSTTVRKIVRENKIKNPASIKPGMKLKIS